MATQVEELADNRVRLRVDVPRADVHHAVEHVATDLAQTVKIPGFRKGKIPRPVLISRVGKDRLFREAVETHIGNWFWSAAATTRIRPVAQPEFDYEPLASDAEDWSFTATVAVQPKVQLADWTELEVPAGTAEVPDDLVEHELNVLRGTVAELAPVEGRPAQEGDTVVVDLVGSDDDGQRDYVVELGSGRLVEEIERELTGLSAGESKEIQFELEGDATRSVTATVKEIKEKILPPLDDRLARAASEFETLEELRTSIHERLLEEISEEVESGVRVGAVDELVRASGVEARGPVVEQRTRELLTGLARAVERRGIPFETYLQLTGTSPEEVVARLHQEAGQSVARELVLEAAAEQLGLQVSDGEVEALVREQAEAGDEDVEQVLSQVRESGAFERLREDLRLRAALDRVAAEVKRIPLEQAAAREAIWTPDKEKPATETNLWTPGSKEPA